MKTVKSTEKEIPVVDKADVVICGGGPAGIIAAIAAARIGVDTILVERYGFLGGMATAGKVGPIDRFRFNGKKIIGGIPWEFVEKLEDNGGAITDFPSGNIHFDSEIYKLISQRMVLEAGVRLWLHSYISEYIKNEECTDQNNYIIIESKSGREAIIGDCFVDATGDGDLIARAGLPFHKGSDNANGLQPMSLCFRLGGVDTDSLENIHMAQGEKNYFNCKLRKALQDAREKGQVPKFGGPWLLQGSTIREGEVFVNVTRYAGDGTNVRDLTEAECQLREDMFDFINFMLEEIPELSNSYLLDSACQVGIRETRRLQGLYTMTKEDIINPFEFSDTVALGAHPIDIHASQDTNQILQNLKQPYYIPFRALVPKKPEDILGTGRNISANREAYASIRTQATCMALGQAAGIAAAQCSKNNLSPTTLDGSRVRELLAQTGAITTFNISD